jgi:GntR family transcriptional regulator
MRTVRADDPRTKAVQIAADLRERIEAGEFPVGAKLPSLRKLSADYGVAQETAKDGLEQLCSGGMARRVEGRGYFVGEETAPDSPDLATRVQELEAEVSELRSRVATLESSE